MTHARGIRKNLSGGLDVSARGKLGVCEQVTNFIATDFFNTVRTIPRSIIKHYRMNERRSSIDSIMVFLNLFWRGSSNKFFKSPPNSSRLFSLEPLYPKHANRPRSALFFLESPRAISLLSLPAVFIRSEYDFDASILLLSKLSHFLRSCRKNAGVEKKINENKAPGSLERLTRRV